MVEYVSPNKIHDGVVREWCRLMVATAQQRGHRLSDVQAFHPLEHRYSEVMQAVRDKTDEGLMFYRRMTHFTPGYKLKTLVSRDRVNAEVVHTWTATLADRIAHSPDRPKPALGHLRPFGETEPTYAEIIETIQSNMPPGQALAYYQRMLEALPHFETFETAA